MVFGGSGDELERANLFGSMRTMRRLLYATAISVAAVVGACGVPTPAPLWEGQTVTAAELFERRVKTLQARRKDRPWNPQAEARDPYDILDVKIEDWLATPEGRFAHSIRIPNPVPADSGYRPGMTQQQYFELLCKNEAGEFIFKTVDNVEGIYLIRPRRIYTAAEWEHLYALEDPYGYWVGEWEDVSFEFVLSNLYSYFEIDPAARVRYGAAMKPHRDPSMQAEPPPNAKVARYVLHTVDERSGRGIRLQYDSQPKARYGFTWRGVKRPHDREMGIAGGELIVLDLRTNEVLGVRRGYNVWNGRWTGRACPRYGYLGGQDKTTFFTAWFVAKVIRPPDWQAFFSQLGKTRQIVGDRNDRRY